MRISASLRLPVLAFAGGVAAIGALLAAPAPPADACGPWFPNQLLNQPSRALLSGPSLLFSQEVQRIAPPPKTTFTVVEAAVPEQTTTQQDLADLRAALKEAKVSDSVINGRVSMLRQARVAIAAGMPPQGLQELPDEFRIYLEGASAWHAGDRPKAVAAWQRLLKLPAAKRRWRSVWAAYMIARAGGPPKQAIAAYEEVRRIAADKGMKDTLGLASTSLGWQANEERLRGRFSEAIDLYAEQARHGDPAGINSLRQALPELLANGRSKPKLLQAAATRPMTRRVVTTWLASFGHSRLGDAVNQPNPLVKQWLEAVEAAKVTETEGADTLAWLAYRYGKFDAARRWLKVAPKDAPLAMWARAKLAIRDGDIKGATKLLKKVVTAYGDTRWEYDAPDWSGFGRWPELMVPGAKAQAELTILKLSRDEFREALDLIVRSGYWDDSAYVAERVATLDELKRYVDKHVPVPKEQPDKAQLTREQREERVRRQQLRDLLGRRLVREGRGDEAAPYFASEQLRAELKRYLGWLKKAQNKRLSDAKRAEAFWEAAKIARATGMELMGSVLDPDWGMYDGYYEVGDFSEERAKHPMEKWGPTKAERKRVAASEITPDKRFHYRYVAAGLAWEAAIRMPDDTADTFEVLCTAGRWLMYRDPQFADRFYKSMVRRNPTLPLAQAADANRWFPGKCR